MAKGKTKREFYLDPDEFRAAILDAQRIGEPTVAVCEMFRKLIKRFLSGPRFVRYDFAMLEDMQSASLIKCIKNVKNFKPGRGSPFSYFTLCASCACKDLLKKHYEQINIVNHLRGVSKYPPRLAVGEASQDPTGRE